jgi:hypothetical protein
MERAAGGPPFLRLGRALDQAGGAASDSGRDVLVDLVGEPANATRADLHAAGKLASGFEAVELAAANKYAASVQFGVGEDFRHKRPPLTSDGATMSDKTHAR